MAAKAHRNLRDVVPQSPNALRDAAFSSTPFINLLLIENQYSIKPFHKKRSKLQQRQEPKISAPAFVHIMIR
ncbi:MAG: hypothetical protein MSS85_01320 [Pyramidobacter sp.]|uniref:hypothetical protein n=1 Tax=Pyramidobacter sp. TaxID=1943581 RepID=UPI0025FA7285|nr:hypothetical protein [Pyramidobacter sp.]MCI7402718.1 hypothetical protein [Pyramidobacter sp.]